MGTTMTMRRLLLLPALALAPVGCGGASAPDGAVASPTSSEAPRSSALQRSLEADLADVERKLLTSSDAMLLDRRLVIIAALSALDRAIPGEPPTTWSKDQLLAAMQAQLLRVGREVFSATLEADRRERNSDQAPTAKDRVEKSRAAGDKPVQDRFRGLFGAEDAESEPGRGATRDVDGLEDAPREEIAGGDDDDRRGGEGRVDDPRQRQAAMVRTGGVQLSAEARAAIRRQLPRVQQCVPERSVRTQVRVRAQLHQGRLRAPAVSADPPVAAAVAGCLVEALRAIEVPVDPDAPSRVVAFPFVVEAR